MAGHGKDEKGSKGKDAHGKKDEHGTGHGEKHAEHHEEAHAEGHEENDNNEGGHGGHGEEHSEAHEGKGEEHAKGHEHSMNEGHVENKEPKKKEPPPKKEFSFTDVATLIAIAVIIRVVLKESDAFVSIEPIIPIAVYAGLRYGVDAGILVGLLSYPLSNLFLEGGAFGLWSFLQGLGGAVSGWLGGNARKATKGALVQYTFVGTLLFEVIVNFPDQQLLVWPFSVTHIVSNIVIALLIGELLIKEK